MLRLRFALLVAVVAVTAHDATYLTGHGLDGYPAALGATGHDRHWLPVAIGVVMLPMRRIAPVLLAGSLALLPTLALAHTELAASDPADGSTVTQPPAEVVLTFEAEVGEGSSFGVIGPGGEAAGQGALDLEVADRNVLRGEVTVSEPGAYRVAWSVVGEDEHPVEGEVTFTYDPAEEATAPDTALPAGAGSPATLIGALLIVLAVAFPVRRSLAVRS